MIQNEAWLRTQSIVGRAKKKEKGALNIDLVFWWLFIIEREICLDVRVLQHQVFRRHLWKHSLTRFKAVLKCPTLYGHHTPRSTPCPKPGVTRQHAFIRINCTSLAAAMNAASPSTRSSVLMGARGRMDQSWTTHAARPHWQLSTNAFSWLGALARNSAHLTRSKCSRAHRGKSALPYLSHWWASQQLRYRLNVRL